jgi:hypothetical protein
LIAEVEGESSGQPEQKLYKAIGQGVGTRKCLFRRVVATKSFDV